jgi:very-short-patch-repair endonuclease
VRTSILAVLKAEKPVNVVTSPPAQTNGFEACATNARFVDAARPVPPGKEGADRARNATEAFLYRRLETLPETVGKFRLNAELPIPFDGWGRMEVDLLSVDARVAVELDGAQHLSDPQAYRRDRRKDLLLQQNGYMVLRFLAEDIGKQLDEVLDTILRILANRRIH